MTLVPGTLRPLAARPIRVLIVDDTVEDVRLMYDALNAEGRFRVSSVRGSTEARAALADGVDAAIISAEFWLGDEEGGLRLLRDDHPEVAFIVLADPERDGEALVGLRPGRQDFLSRIQLRSPRELASRVLTATEALHSARRRETMVRWLEREARIDHLSGLYNRRAFDERLHELCRAARVSGENIGLILLDVVGTRLVNEAHGHEAGDAVIRRAANGIAESVRGADFAARIGGDDFGIILPQGDMDLSRRIARRISHRLEAANTREPDELPVEVMFGVASGRDVSAEELFAAAEQQLSACRRTWPSLRLFPTPEDSGPSVA